MGNTTTIGNLFLQDPALVQLMHLLNQYGQAKLVGGCVRDALLNRPIKDIDIATTLPPEKVKELLPKIGATSGDRRDDHGSILTIVGGQCFDVTTLRQDVQTDGRHAKIIFTDQWDQDARRRDFTINALYCCMDGVISDPLNQGLQDLNNQKLQFIGEPADRIQEDYLRILRYFRFMAQLNWAHDDYIVNCIQPQVAKLCTLSKERVYQEISKILCAHNPVTVIELMNKIGIFEQLFHQTVSVGKFQRCITQMPTISLAARLAALGSNTLQLLQSRAEKKLADLITRHIDLASVSYAQLIVEHSEHTAQTIACLRDEIVRYEQIKKQLIVQPFPVKAHHLPLQGKQLGDALKAIKQWWFANNCASTQEDCLLWFEQNHNKL